MQVELERYVEEIREAEEGTGGEVRGELERNKGEMEGRVREIEGFRKRIDVAENDGLEIGGRLGGNETKIVDLENSIEANKLKCAVINESIREMLDASKNIDVKYQNLKFQDKTLDNKQALLKSYKSELSSLNYEIKLLGEGSRKILDRQSWIKSKIESEKRSTLGNKATLAEKKSRLDDVLYELEK